MIEIVVELLRDIEVDIIDVVNVVIVDLVLYWILCGGVKDYFYGLGFVV